MPTKSENDLKAEWLLNNVSNLCNACKTDGMGCRKQAKAIACVQCKDRKRECSRMVEWRKFKEEHIHGTSTTTKTSSAQQSTRIIIPPAKPKTAVKPPLVWTQNMMPATTQPPPIFRGWANDQPSHAKNPNTAPTPPLTSPSFILHSEEDEKPDIVPKPAAQLLPIPPPPRQRSPLRTPPQDTVRILETQVRTLKREIQEKENVVETLSSAKERLEIELRDLRKTRLDEFLHISANRIKFQGTVNRFFSRQLSAADFRTEMQEFQHTLEELGARHLDQFPTDFEDGVDLLDNYRDSGRRGRSGGDLLDSREAKKLRTE